MPVEAVRLVLRQYDDLSQTRIDEVRDREVDQAVLAAERHGWFGAVGGEGHESLALAAGEDDSEDLRRCRHGTTLGPVSAPSVAAFHTASRVLGFVPCASTSSPRSTRRRSTAARGCTRQSS